MFKFKNCGWVVFFLALSLQYGCGSAEKKHEGKKNVQSISEKKTGNAQAAPSVKKQNSKCIDAIEKASTENRYLLIFFTGGPVERGASMRDTLSKMISMSGGGIDTLTISAGDSQEAEFMRKYRIGSQGSLPMILSIAPNGAATGGYPMAVTVKQLQSCTSLDGLVLETLKPLQEQKVVLVALQNETTTMNTESLKGVDDFASDTLYRKFVAVVKADPADEGSRDFVKQCQLTTPLAQATVVILMPPGRIGKILTGKQTKEDILKALGSCATGCAPGGCSDRRFKENVEPVVSALGKVTKLKGVTFTWNRKDYPKRFFSDKRQIGVIAQDVETVIPEVVHTDKDGFRSVEYDKLTAVLIEAVKEMDKKIDLQDSIITAQNARIEALEAKK